MLNQAAVEALYSASYVEDYLDCVENLPDDVQRHFTQLREYDQKYQSKPEYKTHSNFLSMAYTMT